MQAFPEKIENVTVLEELLSRPEPDVVEMMKNLDGDFIFLGVGGKIGPSLAQMAKRACEQAGVSKKIYGVSLFVSEEERQAVEAKGIETIHGDLLDTSFLASLPEAKNVVYMAGMKFGSTENIGLTWAINTYLPGLVAERFKKSRIVAYSTGCVYPLVDIKTGGCTEQDPPVAYGEYAQSSLGRERMFQFGSQKYNTPVTIIRLNYAIDMRYGVLSDIALKVKNNQPVDLEMGHVNVIWQGDANHVVLRAFDIAASPAKILNITGPEILSVRRLVEEFAVLFNTEPIFTGQEADSALLSNSSEAHRLFGYPQVTSKQLVEWLADWINNNRTMLGKPTHFEARDGKY